MTTVQCMANVRSATRWPGWQAPIAVLMAKHGNPTPRHAQPEWIVDVTTAYHMVFDKSAEDTEARFSRSQVATPLP